VNANLEFKAQYGKVLRYSLLITLIIHFLVFYFSPPFTFKPYRLKEEKFEVVEIAQEIEIPPPPEHIPRPQVDIEVSDELSEEEEQEIPETLFEKMEEIPPPPVSGDAGPQEFVAFDTPPELIKVVPPKYPDLAREAGIEGKVLVQVRVGIDGKVASAFVLQSDVTPDMEEAALAAARRCLFKPAKQRNIPVAADVAIPFYFRLN
jgi:protein TonB